MNARLSVESRNKALSTWLVVSLSWRIMHSFIHSTIAMIWFPFAIKIADYHKHQSQIHNNDDITVDPW